jgi:hypothetical protein
MRAFTMLLATLVALFAAIAIAVCFIQHSLALPLVYAFALFTN